MVARVQVYAPLNLLVGIILFIMGYIAVVMYHMSPDLTSCGIWGGMFLIGAGVATIKRHAVLMLAFAVLSTLSGLVIMATYIWSVATIYVDGGRVAQDVLFIVFGFISFITNVILIHDSKFITKEETKHQRLDEVGQQQIGLAAYLQSTTTPPTVVNSRGTY